MLTVVVKKEIDGKEVTLGTKIDENTVSITEFNRELQTIIGTLLDKESAAKRSSRRKDRD